MISRLKKILTELRKHFLNIPSISLNVYDMPAESIARLDAINQEIGNVLKNKDQRLLFILSPLGMGKTTQIFYFLQKNPHIHSKYRSFLRSGALQGMFFQLTAPFVHLLLALLGVGSILLLCALLPSPSIFPLIALSGIYLMKSFNQTAYLLQETLKNIFSSKEELWILEDLDRCPVSDNQRFQFLSNLWKMRCTYIVTLGYPLGDKKERLKLIEGAIKLGGRVIEIFPDESINYALLKKLDPEIPFTLKNIAPVKQKGWLSLFTLREIKMLYEQALLEMSRVDRKIDLSLAKKLIYIDIFHELLKVKLDISLEESFFVKERLLLQMPAEEKVSSFQFHFLLSFAHSIERDVGLTIRPNLRQESKKWPANSEKLTLTNI